MWSKKPQPEFTSDTPLPSKFKDNSISVSLVVPCIKDDAQLNANGRVTGITFNWMNKTNSIVTKWTPKVDGKLMILTANSRSGNKAYMNSENEVVEIANSPVQPVSVIPTLAILYTSYYTN